jgi:hypothetical protein
MFFAIFVLFHISISYEHEFVTCVSRTFEFFSHLVHKDILSSFLF